jgi:hypothetical protein
VTIIAREREEGVRERDRERGKFFDNQIDD